MSGNKKAKRFTVDIKDDDGNTEVSVKMDFKTTTDSDGRIILYSEPKSTTAEVAFKDCDFITLPKIAADAIRDFISDYIQEHSEFGDPVRALGGDTAAYYEMLVDRTDGLIYENIGKLETKV